MKLFRKVKPTKTNPYFNHEGYADPTAFHGMKNIIKEESEVEDKLNTVIHIIKSICDISGFEVVGRIQFKHKKSGRIFK